MTNTEALVLAYVLVAAWLGILSVAVAMLAGLVFSMRADFDYRVKDLYGQLYDLQNKWDRLSSVFHIPEEETDDAEEDCDEEEDEE